MIKIGPTNPCQPLDIAKAAAVVGPPAFALLASIISSILNLNNFPKNSVIDKLKIKITATKINNNGAVLIMIGIDAGTPITTKKIYIKMYRVHQKRLNSQRIY